MKILALDIGAGTEDVLLYDDKKKIENCIKVVLPSPSLVYAEQVRKATRMRRDIFVKGDIIGGGTFSLALINHIKEGFRVFMTEKSSYTVKNNCKLVKELGIEIVKLIDPTESSNIETLFIEEVNLDKLSKFLTDFNENLFDVDFVAIAVQDHGVCYPGTSNRKFRIKKMKEFLENDSKPESLAFMEDNIPKCFLRMKSAAQASRRQLPETKVMVMDTAPAAILGCLSTAIKQYGLFLAVNFGNSHTMATLISEGRIMGLMELHTGSIDRMKIVKLLTSFADGTLKDKEVFNEGGHGLFYLQSPSGFSKLEKIVITGPNRIILEGASPNVHIASPAGDVMMTGPIGLIEALRMKNKI
jgi:uncharacterized protein (DUF1786 family)